MKEVSVIIVNYNQKELLIRCLNSLRNQTYKNIDIWVIDDCSKDGTVEIIRKNFPEVNLLVNKEEKLLSNSQNIGIKNTTGEYIFFLENDVILEKNYIEELLKVFNHDKNIGMAVGLILRDDCVTIDSAGLFLSKSRKPIERGFNQKNNGQFIKAEYIFGVGQIAGIFRRQLLEDIKLNGEYFDETYGIFYEDLDLAWRANLLGWKAFYNPKAVAYHIRGATTKSKNIRIKFFKKYYFPYLSKELQFHYIKNRYMTILKNDSLQDFLNNLFYILLYEIKLWIYVLLFYPQMIFKIPSMIKYLKIALVKRRYIKKILKKYNTDR